MAQLDGLITASQRRTQASYSTAPQKIGSLKLL